MSGFQPGAGQALAHPFQIEEIGSMAALEALAPEWRNLWERCGRATPFQHPGWALPWLRAFFRGEALLTLALCIDGRLAAVVPFFQHRHRDRSRVRQISFIGTGVSDCLDVLAEPDLGADAAAATLQYLASHRDNWDICDLDQLPPDSALAQAAIPRGLKAALAPGDSGPVLELPATREQLYLSLDPAFRRSIRLAQKHCGGPGAFAAATAGDLDECMQALFRLHTPGWNGTSYTGTPSDREMRDMHREAAGELLKAQVLRLYVLPIQSHIAAALYTFTAHGRVFAYLDGFDPDFAKMSPSAALMAYAIEKGIEDSAREFSFLRGPENFKDQWGAKDLQNQRLVLWHGDSLLPSADWPDSLDAGV